jgi:hypothetical protein
MSPSKWLNRSEQSEDLIADGRIILKLIFEKLGSGVWIGFI